MLNDYRSVLLSPRGRLSRRDFWIVGAGLFAAGIVAGLLPLVGPVFSVVLLWPWTCVSAKRLHDMDRSAAWLALPLVPTAAVAMLGVASFFGLVLGGALLAMIAAGAVLGGIAMILGLGFLIWIGSNPGSPSPNRFGPPPMPLITA